MGGPKLAIANGDAMPRSQTALELFRRAQIIAANLYRITVTDSWYPGQGGNIEVASEDSQRHSMASVLSGITALRSVGGAVGVLRGQYVNQSKESWLVQGRNTLAKGKGVCTDCAAAAAVKFLEFLEPSPYEAKVEVISSTTHAFVVVNRAGAVRTPAAWGDDCFVIDVWYQNQFGRHAKAGAFWADDRKHDVASFIRQNAFRLRVDVGFREVIGSLFD
jgi:hypothetical protein